MLVARVGLVLHHERAIRERVTICVAGGAVCFVRAPRLMPGVRLFAWRSAAHFALCGQFFLRALEGFQHETRGLYLRCWRLFDASWHVFAISGLERV